MKTTTTILAGLTAISAAMANAQYIGLMSVRSASPVHLLPVQAVGQRLYLGGTSAHYCPSDMQTLGACPNTDDTNFESGEGELFMGATVPGGQQVYIDATCGAVSYTQAHSMFMPNGSIIGGWSLDQGPSFGSLAWQNPNGGNGGVVACNDTGTAGVWSVYAEISNITMPSYCLGFDLIATNETKPAAWQYM